MSVRRSSSAWHCTTQISTFESVLVERYISDATSDWQGVDVAEHAQPRRRLTREQRREQILGTATEAFARWGFTPTSLDDIAAAAGVAQTRNLEILSVAARRSLPLEARVRPRYNPGLRSPNYIVPGLVGVILTLTMVLVTAIALVRERERGTLEQLIVTPITRTELMLGKISPYVGVGLFQMTVVLFIAVAERKSMFRKPHRNRGAGRPAARSAAKCRGSPP